MAVLILLLTDIVFMLYRLIYEICQYFDLCTMYHNTCNIFVPIYRRGHMMFEWEGHDLQEGPPVRKAHAENCPGAVRDGMGRCSLSRYLFSGE